MKYNFITFAFALLAIVAFTPNTVNASDEMVRGDLRNYGLFSMELGDPDATTQKDEIRCVGPGVQCLVY